MSRAHVVKPGESLARIAMNHGFRDWRTVYDHADNAELKAKRPNPDLLHPGDRVAIPDREVKVVECEVGRRHRFRVPVPTRTLRLRVQDPAGEPIVFGAWKLRVGDFLCEGETDGEGMLEEEVPLDAETAQLEVGDLRWELRIADLNPLDDAPDQGASGVQARLKNLGFDPGPIDGAMGPRTRGAIRAFEAANGLPITGKAEGATLAKLRELHGS
jgi:N-acetylmuramoyl-L-alanine amidase